MVTKLVELRWFQPQALHDKSGKDLFESATQPMKASLYLAFIRYHPGDNADI